ncbi:hypothetical protein WL86_30365 [Burkholderia diffusa]|nr:hypothetical protein WL86_30365 [Burkholderia diffusa]
MPTEPSVFSLTHILGQSANIGRPRSLRSKPGDRLRNFFQRLESLGVLLHERTHAIETCLLRMRHDIDEYQCACRDMLLASGHKTGSTAHRRAGQYGLSAAQSFNDALEITNHCVLAIVAVWRPV